MLLVDEADSGQAGDDGDTMRGLIKEGPVSLTLHIQSAGMTRKGSVQFEKWFNTEVQKLLGRKLKCTNMELTVGVVGMEQEDAAPVVSKTWTVDFTLTDGGLLDATATAVAAKFPDNTPTTLKGYA